VLELAELRAGIEGRGSVNWLDDCMLGSPVSVVPVSVDESFGEPMPRRPDSTGDPA